ncbi:MAG: hypothetical protein VX589_07230 [Myxococcota bacterium]|nr:hypothetical protein [Myxococcota bacterium]
MKPQTRVFVVGGGHSTFMGRARPEFIHRRHPDFGSKQNPTIQDHLADALRETYDVTGVDPSLIDKVYLSNFLGETFLKQGHLSALLVDVEPAFDGKPIARIEAACASGSSAIAACIDALQGGCETAMAVGAEIETNVPGRDGIEYMAYAAHMEKQRQLDTYIFPYFFARRAKAYCDEFGASMDDIAHVVAKAYANANRNPRALHRTTTMSYDFARTPSDKNYLFVEDEELKPYIRLTDCTAFTDGASAVVLATEDGLRRLNISPADCTEILAYGHSVAPLAQTADPYRLANMRRAALQAYSDAGIGGDAMQIAEVHDCFAVAEIQMYEALELCDEGQGHRLLTNGHTQIDGRIPVNTGGGLLGFGHPIGATGIKQVVEIWRQMKGHCGDYQVSSRPEYGVSANLGGDDRTGVVMVHRNVSTES